MPSDHLLEAALSSLGIYPQSVTQGGVTIPRSQYGEGWNDAQMQGRRRHIKMCQWFSALPKDAQEAFDLLSEADLLSVNFDDWVISLEVVVNDVFVPAAHSERVEATDLPVLARLYRDFEHEGVYAWVGREIGMSPRINRVHHGRYDAATLTLPPHAS